jgi:hypothetical protein
MFVWLPHSQAVICCCRKSPFLHQQDFLPRPIEECASVKVVQRLGLCITVEVFCRNCSCISDAVDLFTTVPSSRSPDAISLNVRLIPVLKSKVGISDVVQVLSCLNIKSPDRRGLQRRFNRLSDMMVDVNKQWMIDNQTYVKHILQLAGEENLVDVESLCYIQSVNSLIVCL